MQIKTKTQKKEEITKMRDYHHQSGGDGESDLIATLLASYGEWIEPNMDGSFLNSFSHFIIQYVDYAKHLTGYANQTTLVKVLMMKSVAFEAILFYMAHFDAGRRERILDSIYVLGKEGSRKYRGASVHLRTILRQEPDTDRRDSPRH